MNDATTDHDQRDEEILADEVSDDVLEQAGAAGEKKITNREYGTLKFTPCC